MRLYIPLFLIAAIAFSAVAASAVPTAPTVLWPMSGKTIKLTTPYIHWTGVTHTSYQVRICTANNADTGIAWDSGQVTSALNHAQTGTLTTGTTYYAFVKIADGTGWSAWSAGGYSFTVDTSYQPPRRGNVHLTGFRLEDDGGPFIGLGFSYMQALRRCKYDRDRFRDDLAFMASNNFKYMRALSMVGWYSAWQGKEIAPVSFYSQNTTYVPAWPDYWQQLRDMVDVAYDEYGIRTELTIFADAQLMPTEAARYEHMDSVLSNLIPRQQKMMHLEVANEAWQNGFPEPGGTTQLRAFTQYLADRTTMIVATTSNHEADIHPLYDNSAADMATYHFSRDKTTFEGGWLPVRDCWWAKTEFPNLPFSSNEPIGPGSSVDSESDPIKLVSAACFAFTANLAMYVYHMEAGVFGVARFEDEAGVRDYRFLEGILPPDLSNWTRNDGKEAAAPFTVYCNGVANTYWTDNQAGTDGCHRNIGGIKNNEFFCYPQGIRAGGLTLQARKPVYFTVYNPLTGAIVLGPVAKNTGETFTLSTNPGSYVIKGNFIVMPPTAFTVTRNGTTNNISWTNPPDTGFAGTTVRYSTTDYPISPSDGNALCDGSAAPGSNESFAHTPVNSAINYYYGAWSHDGIPLYSPTGVFASTVLVPDWLNEKFDAYADGRLGGKGGWTTTTASSSQVQSYAAGGTGKAALLDAEASGSSIVNQISITDKNSGYHYLSFDVAEDAAGAAGQLVGCVTIYGSSSTNDIAKLQIQKGRIFMEYGTGLLATVATTMINGTFYTVRVGLNVDTRKMDVWLNGVRKVTNYNWKGTGTNISRIVISSDRNTSLTPQKLYIDNLRFQPTTGIVDTVRDDGPWTPSLSTLHFNFDAVSGIPEYRYAIGSTSGGAEAKGWTSCGTTVDNTATGLSLAENQTYYVSVQCSAGGGVWGGSVTSDGITAAPGIATIQAAKALGDSSSVKALRGKLVSAAFPGYFYVQEPTGPFALKVISSASVAAGDLVDVAGSMGGSGSERVMTCTGNPVSKAAGPGGPYPVLLNNGSLGGIVLNGYTPGVSQGIGLNNIGLLVTVVGKVTQRKTAAPGQYFYIDDGSGRSDGTQTDGVDNAGIRISGDPASYTEGAFVSVTGVSSCFDELGLKSQVLPTSITILRP